MADQVNPLVTDVINEAQKATLYQGAVQTSGAGKAYQSVAQSSAIAVQDATDALRNISTVASTAAGVALAQIMATGDPEGKYGKTLSTAQTMITKAIDDYKQIGTAASSVLTGFPSGPSGQG